MAYDHNGDVPETYDLAAAVRRIENPGWRELLHSSAERADLLNVLGHASITEVVARAPTEIWSPSYADLGVTIYEAVTALAWFGGNSGQFYRDAHGAQVAMNVAFGVTQLDNEGLDVFKGQVMTEMVVHAPVMNGLVGDIARRICDETPSSRAVREVQCGAAMMRWLHITANETLREGE